jgi:hypothetical protein
VPQGSKRSELLAIARKHRAQLTGDTAASSLSSASSKASASDASAYGAATSAAGNQYAKATDDASIKAQAAFDAAVDTWSDSRLKAYLDARGGKAACEDSSSESRRLTCISSACTPERKTGPASRSGSQERA